MATITGLYAGALSVLQPDGEQTGIFKRPIDSAVVTCMGIIGDQQADRRYHGGPEKALHQFAQVSYDQIVSEFPSLEGMAKPGSIGENISSSDLTDETVYLGDCYRMGEVLVQVSQPRRPCWKINHKFSIERLSIFVEQRNIAGWYYRVLETGTLRVDDAIELLERPNPAISVAYFTKIARQHRPDLELLQQLIECRGLNLEWKTRLQKRHDYLQQSLR